MLVYLVTSTSTLKTLFSGLQDTGTQGELGHIRAYVHNATFSTERREIHKGAVQLVLQRSVAPDSLQPDGNLQLSGRVYLSRHRSIVRPDIWVVRNKSPRWPSRKGAVKQLLRSKSRVPGSGCVTNTSEASGLTPRPDEAAHLGSRS